MPTWLILAKGPVLRFTLAVLALGLLRLVIINAWQMVSAIRQAGDQHIPYRQIIQQTLSWLIPIRRLGKDRTGYSLASFVFHVGIVIVALFLRNHLDILQANTGLTWLAIPKPVLDWLTLGAIFGGSFLLFYRLYVRSSRKLSKFGDYFLLALILNIFVSGFIAGQPWNPIAYDSLMLFHTLNGILLLLIIPFTKIAHCVLFPIIRLSTEIAWRLVPQGGSKAVKTLYGPQERKI